MINHGQINVDEDNFRKLVTISVSTLKQILSSSNKAAEKISRNRFPKRRRINLW
jgi:hypothetical protein